MKIKKCSECKNMVRAKDDSCYFFCDLGHWHGKLSESVETYAFDTDCGDFMYVKMDEWIGKIAIRKVKENRPEIVFVRGITAIGLLACDVLNKTETSLATGFDDLHDLDVELYFKLSREYEIKHLKRQQVRIKERLNELESETHLAT